MHKDFQTNVASTASSAYPALPALVQYPHPVLRRAASPVTVFDDELRDFCQRMFTVMELKRGVGLAAPQVAVSKRIFVTDHVRRKDEPEAHDRRVWINPRLVDTQGETVYEEGCLSFPGIYAKVTRWNNLTAVWQDEWGREQRLSLDIQAGDFLGIIIQHELDHLDGRLFVDHLSPAQLSVIKGRIKDLEREYKHETGKDGAVMRR